MVKRARELVLLPIEPSTLSFTFPVFLILTVSTHIQNRRPRISEDGRSQVAIEQNEIDLRDYQSILRNARRALPIAFAEDKKYSMRVLEEQELDPRMNAFSSEQLPFADPAVFESELLNRGFGTKVCTLSSLRF